MSKITDLLKRTGPTALEELPYNPNWGDRRKIRKFGKSLGSGAGSSVLSIGKQCLIVYLPDRHQPYEVVSTFLTYNSLEELPDQQAFALYRSIVEKYGTEFGEAARDVLGPFDTYDHAARNKANIEPSNEADKDCPFCGKEDIHYARHLPTCEEKP